MTLRAAHGRTAAESSADVATWLRGLSGCPTVTDTVPARCHAAVHGDEPGEWFYVEADAVEGVARRRCLGCAAVTALLDSDERWSYPPSWSCTSCAQSIAEVVYGVAADGDAATWVAMAVRCVNCGDIDGVTDAVVPRLPLSEVLTSL